MRLFKSKDKGPYPKSFAKRLTRRIMVTLFITMSVVSLIIYGIAWIIVMGNAVVLSTDTARLLLLTPDSLVLQFPDGPQYYYKKVEE